MIPITSVLSQNGSARGSWAITPHNTNKLPKPTRSITIGGAGTLSWIAPDGVTYNTNSLPAGTYPIQAVRVRVTGTTATQITGWS